MTAINFALKVWIFRLFWGLRLSYDSQNKVLSHWGKYCRFFLLSVFLKIISAMYMNLEQRNDHCMSKVMVSSPGNVEILSLHHSSCKYFQLLIMV